MELVGLPEGLRRLFPAHEFYSIEARPGEPHNGFTSSRLPSPGGRTNLRKLVEAAGAHLVPGRRGDPPDLLFVLDDLELDNADQPQVVVDAFRAEALAYLFDLGRDRPALAARVAAALQQQAAFHLAAPMIESWLFADPSGPANAGALPTQLPPRLQVGADPEAFQADDPAYSADDGGQCVQWAGLSPAQLRKKSKRKANKPEWVARDDKDRHPKAYLAWLCRDHGEKKCSTYRETRSNPQAKSGATALAALDWQVALSHAEQCLFLRAFVEDIADGLGIPSPIPPGDASPLTSRHDLPPDPVLRNL
jgi:hypothetical protein